MGKPIYNYHKPKTKELSPRERDVLKLLALGYTAQQSADQCGVSSKTTEKQLANVRAKTGRRTVPSLTMLAIKMGLVELV